MSRLAEGLSRFFGRVEIFARGADEDRRAAEQALEREHYLEARAAARALLARVPRSPVGLALWADAAEACWLDDEVVEALSQLCEQVPWRQEIWLRLGQAGRRTGWEHARGALERAAAARDDPAVVREALFELCDADLAAGEPLRAQRWLDRVPYHPSQSDPELALRRAECAIALSRPADALAWSARMDGMGGGRARLVRAALAHLYPNHTTGADALSLALGAFLLEAPGSDELLVQLCAESRDAALVARVREVVRALDRLAEPRWQAAFALAEGRRADARKALVEAARAGDRDAARTLLSLALSWRDPEALEAAAGADRRSLAPALRQLLEAHTARARGEPRRALTLLDAAAGEPGEIGAWAGEALGRIIRGWIGEGDQPSHWDEVLRELRRAATALERLELIAPMEALAVERTRPLYVAVLGEFNAGKSTFINALLGVDVAPTGVRPTTASLHWVAWAPDPFARVVVRGGSDRVVPHAELKRALDELRGEGAAIDRVLIYAPIERLKRIELLDTPGFNAPETTHAEEARRGIEEAHVALWLLDGTAPLKHSERLVIEQVAAAGVPIQVLVNKRDRVGEEAIDAVMRYVHDSLAEVGIISLSAPIALSAERALAGRLGDDEALVASRWHDVEALLEEQFVNRSDLLRERALRRKAARIAAELERAAGERVAERRAERALNERRARESAALAARLRAERGALAEAMLGELSEAQSALRADARPLRQLPEERRRDPEVRGYLIDRTVERLAPAVVEAILAHARKSSGWDEEALAALGADAAPGVRAALAGAAAAVPAGSHLDGELLRAALEITLVAAAEAVDRTVARAAPPSTEEALARRLAALAAALAGDGSPAQQAPEVAELG